jgi:hypothetical protein
MASFSSMVIQARLFAHLAAFQEFFNQPSFKVANMLMVVWYLQFQ